MGGVVGAFGMVSDANIRDIGHTCVLKGHLTRIDKRTLPPDSG